MGYCRLFLDGTGIVLRSPRPRRFNGTALVMRLSSLPRRLGAFWERTRSNNVCGLTIGLSTDRHIPLGGGGARGAFAPIITITVWHCLIISFTVQSAAFIIPHLYIQVGGDENVNVEMDITPRIRGSMDLWMVSKWTVERTEYFQQFIQHRGYVMDKYYS